MISSELLESSFNGTSVRSDRVIGVTVYLNISEAEKLVIQVPPASDGIMNSFVQCRVVYFNTLRTVVYFNTVITVVYFNTVITVVYFNTVNGCVL